MPDTARPRESWGTRVGVILAVTGSAVGLGNFLRFPGKAAQYEGGAFMVPYFIALFLLGLPIALAEWSLGRYGGSKGYNSVPGIFRAVWNSRAASYLGGIGLLIPVIIYMYYVYIEAWCLGYAYKFAVGEMALGSDPAAYSNFFSTFIGDSEDGAALTSATQSLSGFLTSSLGLLLICFALNFFLIYRGLKKGIEWFCKWAMPALIVCAVVVLIRVLTLGTPNPDLPDRNLLNGLGHMWNPGGAGGKTFWQALLNAEMWLEAAGQIFFSLSVGFGIVLCYSSYLKPDDDIALSSVTASAGNEFCEVALGGLIAIPAAFIFLGPKGAGGSTFGLGFITLPNVFAAMPAGRWIGALFFFLLFLAAVTSSLSMLQPAIALLEEGLGLGRKASVAFLGFITAIGAGFVFYFSKDVMALDTMDFWVGTVCIYVLAMIEVILFAWVMGIEKGFAELTRGAEIKIPRFVMYIIKYVSPTYLLIIFGVWIYQMATAQEGNKFSTLAENPIAQLSVGLMLTTLVLFLFLIAQSNKRWDAQEARAAALEGETP